MNERTDKRGSHSKTFELGAGKFRTVITRLPIHYKKDSQWLDLDPSLKQRGNGVVCDSLPFGFELLNNKIGYRIDGAGLTATVELQGEFNLSGRTISHNTVWFLDALPELDIGFQVTSYNVRAIKRLKSSQAPRSFTWRITEKGDSSHRPPAGRDNELGGEENRRDLQLNSTRFNVTKNDGITSYELTETWSGKVWVRERATRILSLSDDVIYPVTMDPTFGPAQTASGDDGFETDPAGTWASAFYRFTVGKSGSNLSHGGVRFSGVTVPQGATIVQAILAVTGETNYNGPPDLTIKGDDVDNAPAFSSSSRPSQMAFTTATVPFTPSNTTAATVDIASIIQEIVNRPGWASGNAIRIGLMQEGAVGGFKETGLDSSNDGGGGPTLTIDYASASVTPGAALLALTTFAPQLKQTATPPNANLALSTFAPQLQTELTAATHNLALTTFAPSVSVNQILTVGAASLTLSTNAPRLVSTLAPSSQTVNLTTFEPQLPQVATPGSRTLIFDTFAPLLGNNVTVTPDAASLAFTAFAPTLIQPVTIVPQSAALVLVTFAPQLHTQTTPAATTLIISTFAPVLCNAAIPASRVLLLTSSLPQLQAHITITSGSLALMTFAPYVGGSHVLTALPANVLRVSNSYNVLRVARSSATLIATPK